LHIGKGTIEGLKEKGDKRFNGPKSSKVKRVFVLLNKAVRLNFSSYKCKLLKFSLTALLTNKSTFLTFDLLELLKRLSPFSTEPFIYYPLELAHRSKWIFVAYKKLIVSSSFISRPHPTHTPIVGGSISASVCCTANDDIKF